MFSGSMGNGRRKKSATPPSTPKDEKANECSSCPLLLSKNRSSRLNSATTTRPAGSQRSIDHRGARLRPALSEAFDENGWISALKYCIMTVGHDTVQRQ